MIEGPVEARPGARSLTERRRDTGRRRRGWWRFASRRGHGGLRAAVGGRGAEPRTPILRGRRKLLREIDQPAAALDARHLPGLRIPDRMGAPAAAKLGPATHGANSPAGSAGAEMPTFGLGRGAAGDGTSGGAGRTGWGEGRVRPELRSIRSRDASSRRSRGPRDKARARPRACSIDGEPALDRDLSPAAGPGEGPSVIAKARPSTASPSDAMRTSRRLRRRSGAGLAVPTRSSPPRVSS